MPAMEESIILERGSDYEVQGYMTDDYGNPLDISNDTFIGTVSDFCGGTVLASFVYTLYFDMDNPKFPDGIWMYVESMPRAIISSLPITEGYWEQYQVSPDNLSTKNIFGPVEVACKTTTVPA